jgi:hypothetical protein
MPSPIAATPGIYVDLDDPSLSAQEEKAFCALLNLAGCPGKLSGLADIRVVFTDFAREHLDWGLKTTKSVITKADYEKILTLADKACAQKDSLPAPLVYCAGADVTEVFVFRPDEGNSHVLLRKNGKLFQVMKETENIDGAAVGAIRTGAAGPESMPLLVLLENKTQLRVLRLDSLEDVTGIFTAGNFLPKEFLSPALIGVWKSHIVLTEGNKLYLIDLFEGIREPVSMPGMDKDFGAALITEEDIYYLSDKSIYAYSNPADKAFTEIKRGVPANILELLKVGDTFFLRGKDKTIISYGPGMSKPSFLQGLKSDVMLPWRDGVLLLPEEQGEKRLWYWDGASEKAEEEPWLESLDGKELRLLYVSGSDLMAVCDGEFRKLEPAPAEERTENQ